VPWLKLVLKVSWKEALAFGLLPFIVGAVIKIIVAVMVRQFLRLSSNQDN
jgi:biotin transporter BioY